MTLDQSLEWFLNVSFLLFLRDADPCYPSKVVNFYLWNVFCIHPLLSSSTDTGLVQVLLSVWFIATIPCAVSLRVSLLPQALPPILHCYFSVRTSIGPSWNIKKQNNKTSNCSSFAAEWNLNSLCPLRHYIK